MRDHPLRILKGAIDLALFLALSVLASWLISSSGSRSFDAFVDVLKVVCSGFFGGLITMRESSSSMLILFGSINFLGCILLFSRSKSITIVGRISLLIWLFAGVGMATVGV